MGRVPTAWSSATFGAAITRVHATLAAVEPKMFSGELHHFIERLGNTLDESIQLERLAAICLALDLDRVGPRLADNQVLKLIELAQSILKLRGIDPVDSRLSFLHAYLHAARADLSSRSGDTFRAVWHQQQAMISGRKTEQEFKENLLLRLAAYHKRAGDLKHASEALRIFLDTGATDARAAKARMELAECLRLAGRFKEAQTEAQMLGQFPTFAERTRWLELTVAVAQGGGLDAMLKGVAPKGAHRSYTRQLEANLWVWAHASPKWLGQPMKPESIRKTLRETSAESRVHDPLFEAVVALHNCHDTAVPLLLRLEGLERVLARTHLLPTVEQELLVNLAAARWLYRRQQFLTARFVLERFEQMSRRQSTGRTKDVLGLAEGFRDKSWSFLAFPRRQGQAAEGGVSRLSASFAGRAFALSKLTARVAGSVLESKIKAVGKDAAHAATLRDEAAAKIADLMFATIGAMKGPVVKFFQMAAFMGYDLPEPVRQRFERFYDDTQALPAATIRDVLTKTWDRPIAEALASFDDEPLAAASIGQVHRATLSDGREIVVKVRYPGIESAVRTDLKAGSLIVPFLELLFPGIAVRRVYERSRTAAIKECDLRLEAKCQDRFRAHLADSPDFVVPEVIPELSTEEVLVMTYYSGRTTDEFARTATLEERAAASVKILELGFRSLFIEGVVNADPHPGNFLFLDNGRILLLDFGMVVENAPERTRDLTEVLRSVLAGDYPAFEAVYRRLGYAEFFERGAGGKLFAFIHRFVAKPLGEASFTFDEALLQDLRENAGGAGQDRFLMLPEDDFYIPRFFIGLLATLSMLEAPADYRPVAARLAAILRNGNAGTDAA